MEGYCGSTGSSRSIARGMRMGGGEGMVGALRGLVLFWVGFWGVVGMGR